MARFNPFAKCFGRGGKKGRRKSLEKERKAPQEMQDDNEEETSVPLRYPLFDPRAIKEKEGEEIGEGPPSRQGTIPREMASQEAIELPKDEEEEVALHEPVIEEPTTPPEEDRPTPAPSPKVESVKDEEEPEEVKSPEKLESVQEEEKPEEEQEEEDKPEVKEEEGDAVGEPSPPEEPSKEPSPSVHPSPAPSPPPEPEPAPSPPPTPPVEEKKEEKKEEAELPPSSPPPLPPPPPPAAKTPSPVPSPPKSPSVVSAAEEPQRASVFSPPPAEETDEMTPLEKLESAREGVLDDALPTAPNTPRGFFHDEDAGRRLLRKLEEMERRQEDVPDVVYYHKKKKRGRRFRRIRLKWRCVQAAIDCYAEAHEDLIGESRKYFEVHEPKDCKVCRFADFSDVPLLQ